MGTHYQFICSKCSYEATVSGGDDCGMACRTTTVCCKDCGELYDVVTSDKPWEESDGPPDEELVCPGPAPEDLDDDEEVDRSNPNHRVQRWSFPGPCPKCGEMMSKGDCVVHWD